MATKEIKEKLAQKLGCSIGSKQANIQCLYVLLGSGEVRNAELHQVLQYLTGMRTNTSEFATKMLELLEQDEGVVVEEEGTNALEEQEKAEEYSFLGESPKNLTDHATHVVLGFQKVTPHFQGKLVQEVQSKEAYIVSILEHAQGIQTELMECLPRLDLDLYMSSELSTAGRRRLIETNYEKTWSTSLQSRRYHRLRIF